MVLMSITTPPALQPLGDAVSGPSTASSTCCRLGQHRDHDLARGPDLARRGRRLRARPGERATASGLRSKTVSAWPPFRMLSAIGPPMTPSPTKPTVTLPFSSLRLPRRIVRGRGTWLAVASLSLSGLSLRRVFHLSLSQTGRPRTVGGVRAHELGGGRLRAEAFVGLLQQRRGLDESVL